MIKDFVFSIVTNDNKGLNVFFRAAKDGEVVESHDQLHPEKYMTHKRMLTLLKIFPFLSSIRSVEFDIFFLSN